MNLPLKEPLKKSIKVFLSVWNLKRSTLQTGQIILAVWTHFRIHLISFSSNVLSHWISCGNDEIPFCSNFRILTWFMTVRVPLEGNPFAPFHFWMQLILRSCWVKSMFGRLGLQSCFCLIGIDRLSNKRKEEWTFAERIPNIGLKCETGVNPGVDNTCPVVSIVCSRSRWDKDMN